MCVVPAVFLLVIFFNRKRGKKKNANMFGARSFFCWSSFFIGSTSKCFLVPTSFLLLAILFKGNVFGCPEFSCYNIYIYIFFSKEMFY